MAIQIHQKRYERQLLAADRWKKSAQLGISHSDGWGTFWWCTGTGKTFAACTIASKMLLKNDAYQFVVVVPSDELEKQWNTEIKQFIPEQHLNNFRVSTVHKLMNIAHEGKRIQCDLLIADELHEYYTEERLKMFDGSFIITRWCLGLTATFEDIEKRHNQIKDILPVIDRIDDEEALREGYISKFIEYNVSCSLNEREQGLYAQYSDIISKNISKFGGNGLKLASAILKGEDNFCFKYAMSKGWYKNMDISQPTNLDIFNQWSPAKIMGYAKNLMNAVRERKSLLYCCQDKLVKGKEVVTKFDTLKTICFSQSTNFADALAYMINEHYKSDGIQHQKPCVVYHSKIDTIVTVDANGKQHKKGKTVLKREAIEAIRTGKARVISTASSLDKGFDVKDIRLAITTSGTQNPTQYSQRKGRALRVEDYAQDIIVLIINLYVKGTTDEVWLRKRQSTSKNVVYWADKVDDINYNPKRNDTFNLTEI